MTDAGIIFACETHFPTAGMIPLEVLMETRVVKVQEEPKVQEPVWQKAEDSFLKFFCRIERFDWGSFYFWDAGQDWPKFNFVRVVTSALTADQLQRLVTKYKPYFLQRGRTFSLKIPEGVVVSPEISERLKPAGIPLVSLKFDPKKLKGANQSDIQLCKSVEDVAVWWEINSDGRSRQGNSPLWPVIVEAFRAGTRYYILRKEGEPVASAALTPFNERQDFNLWGLATRQAHQRRGYIKELVAGVGNMIGIPYYLQVNIESHTHQMFRKLGAEELVVERRYEIA